MGTNFPSALDALTNPTPTDYLNSPSHSGQHANANDSIEALEAKVGIDSSAVTTSHDYKLSEVTGTDKAVGKTATQTITNKTLTNPVITLKDEVPTADGRIGFDRTNEDLVIGDGSAGQLVHMGAWKTWTPTWTNLTLGNGTQVARYTKIGKTVHFEIHVTFGSTTSITGTLPYFTLPVSAQNTLTYDIGLMRILDSGTADYIGFAQLKSATECYIRTMNGATAVVSVTEISSTSPMTWTTNDRFGVVGTYEAA